ncbi:DUF3099 domain-containing protein [Microbacterium sp. BK668]|uniref:DUF3099 domain-containing protein n=1 Tax=Microbacterium sp. BK668 TaxID=2512118 RepID=UPI001FB71E79|nr:DUF3099 domain-containing protein [Microbacterium sp. BK668]
MKNSGGPQSATSLPRAPRDAVGARSTRYLITMGIRVACFILMVVVTPYSWYTWIFAAGAVFLPYIAVVGANVGEDTRSPAIEAPERALPSAPTAAAPPAEGPRIIRLEEQRPLAPTERDAGARHPSAPADPDAERGSSA